MKKQLSLQIIPEENQKEMLRKNWQSADGRWQAAMFAEMGPARGNEINKQIARSVYRGAMFRLLKEFGLTSVSGPGEFLSVLSAALELFHAHSDFSYTIEQISSSVFRAVISQCGTNDSVRRAGVAGIYECGCFSCREGFYDAMHLDVEEKCLKRLLDGDSGCEILITVKKWGMTF